MIARMLFGCLAAIVAAIGAAAGILYCAGRWMIGGEFLFPQMAALFVAVIGIKLVFLGIKPKARFAKITCHLFVIGSLFLFFVKEHALLDHAFFAGFEARVFNVASIEQWGDVAGPFKHWLAASDKSPESRTNFIPNFVRKVCPDEYAYTFVYSNAASKDNYVVFNWRGAGFDSGVQVGKGNGEPPGVFYRKQYSNDVSIVFFGGGE